MNYQPQLVHLRVFQVDGAFQVDGVFPG